MAKEVTSLTDAALCHAVGQACATVHTETHAIGLPIYELTAIVRDYGIEECTPYLKEKLSYYRLALEQCRKEADSPEYKWAPFLLDDSRPNKEKIRLEKGL